MRDDSKTTSTLKIRPAPLRPAVIMLLLLAALAVVGALIALIAVRNRAESAVARLAALIPFGWAYAAGMVASVNPCGFFMLPVYLSYQLSTRSDEDQGQPRAVRAARAIGLGVVATSGFLLILAAVGLIIAAGGQWLVRAFPYTGVVIGAAMALLGIWMLR